MKDEIRYKSGYLIERVKQPDNENYLGTFVLTDETEDRVGDIVVAKGVDVRAFRKNPVALWQHQNDRPVGFWENIRRDGTRWLGDLIASTTNLGQMAKALVDEGTLRAVSIGFRVKPGKLAENPDNPRGFIIKGIELLEASLVSVPANPNALRISKSLGLTEAQRNFIFSDADATPKSVDEGILEAARKRMGLSSSDRSEPNQRGDSIMSLSKKIEALRKQIGEDREALIAASDAYADEANEDNEALVTSLTASIDGAEKQLENLEAAEAAIRRKMLDDATGSQDDDDDADDDAAAQDAKAKAKAAADKGTKTTTGIRLSGARGKMFGDITVRPTSRSKEYDGGRAFMLAAAAKLVAHMEKKTLDDVIKERFPDDRRALDAVIKAAVAPATTTDPTWAGDFLGEQVQGWVDLLMNNSIFGALSARGQSMTFPNNVDTLKIPRRDATPKLDGVFVGEYQPIRVGRMSINSITMEPMKTGVVSTYSNEILRSTGGQIATVIQDAIVRDTIDSVDGVLMSAVAEVSRVSPPGLRNGVTPGTSAGDDVDSIITDWKALMAPFVTSDTSGDVVAIINPARILGLSTVTSPLGVMQFAADVANGVLMGVPLIISANCPAEEVTMVDARDFAFAAGAPAFDVSNVATLHMEDTAPAPIVDPLPGPATVAEPVHSMFQMDAVALRMTHFMTWKMTRDNRVSGMDSVTW